MAKGKTIKKGMDNRQMKQIARSNMSAGATSYQKGEATKKASPMIKPSRKGLLHKKLGVAKGKKIPAAKLNQALNSKSPSERKEANFAKNFGK